MPSSVPSGCIHRWKASGLACRTSSASGPVRLEEKGILKERLTMLSAAVRGVIWAGTNERLIGGGMGLWLSILGLPIPKAAGVIFSQPCRACPVKLLNFCIFQTGDTMQIDEEGKPESRRNRRDRYLGATGGLFDEIEGSPLDYRYSIRDLGKSQA